MMEVLKEEMLARIATAIDPTIISTFISNHAQMEHSGCLPKLHNPLPKRLKASSNVARAVREHFHLNSCRVARQLASIK